MANKIIGITVDIEGKTSGLTKSLQEANSAINKTTSALKDVDKALKLDPDNVELLLNDAPVLEYHSGQLQMFVWCGEEIRQLQS